MIKNILSIISILILNFTLNAQNVNIPDANFKAALLANSSINTNGDTEIQVSEANTYSGSIILSSPFSIINDMTGIEEFIQLVELDMNATGITSIDLSQNVNLEELRLYGFVNQLSPLNALDVTNNTLLTSITCSSTSINSINLSSNSMLEHLNISGNSISNVDLSNNVLLSELFISSCQFTVLDLTNNINLTNLNCSNNQLTALDISTCSMLVEFNCSNNQLTSLNISNNNNSSFTSFNATSNSNLNCIKASNVTWCYNNFTNANGSIDPNTVFSLDCNQCFVNIPDANFKSHLINNASINLNGDNEIECAEAELTTTLDCIGVNISDLTGIEAFINIVTLRCGYNQLNNIDVSNNTQLTWLEVNNNSLISIDVSNNILIDDLDLSENLLTSLDLSSNPQLEWITLNDNDLNQLNLVNGNNTIVGTGGPYLVNNPNLICVEVDNDAYSNSNWTQIDSQTSFSTNCGGNVGVNELNSSEITIYPNPDYSQLYLNVGNEKVKQLRILDYSGKTLEIISGNNLQNIDISELNQGVYLVQISLKSKVYTKKIVK